MAANAASALCAVREQLNRTTNSRQNSNTISFFQKRETVSPLNTNGVTDREHGRWSAMTTNLLTSVSTAASGGHVPAQTSQGVSLPQGAGAVVREWLAHDQSSVRAHSTDPFFSGRDTGVHTTPSNYN